jgi:hypothetical protein
MRIMFSVLAVALALCPWSYLALGWGPVILQQGFEAAITEQSSQPPILVTAACLIVSVLLLVIGVALAFTRKDE